MNVLNKQNIKYLLDINSNYIVIIANGTMPKSVEILELIASANVSIACDGAGIRLNQQNIIPDYIIGDNDSSQNDAKAKYDYIYIENQNLNDLSKAFNLAKELNLDIPILILAANGLREDHSLGNIALLTQFQTKYSQSIHMISDYGIFTPLLMGVHTINSIIKEQISFFAFDKSNQITCQELKWPLENYHLDYLNSGTLNQATANHLNIKTKTPILLYRAFQIK
ncbi:MAG: thiamine diphosphokinase [Burkholderiales bacterium]|nr:thiamine diphosphokinase [Burkholderiales bacterium]